MKTNWPTKKLGEIARIFSGSSAPQDEKYFKNGKFPFVRVFDLATSRLGAELVETRDYVNELAITELNLVKAQKGAIVFPKSGASILNNNRAMLGANAYIVSHLAAVEVNESIVFKNWIYYFLDKFDMGRLVSDPGYPSLNISAIEKIKIPLPPLKIQKQIVERLDKITEAQKLNDELIQKTNELFQSLLHKELNPVRDSKHSNGVNPAGHADKAMAGKKDWEIKKLGSVFDRITDAILPTKHSEEKFNFIGLENIESNTSRLINISPVAGRFIKSTKTRFKIGDVLYGKLRPYLNKVWLADFDGICSTDIWALRAKEGIILPQLLGAILQQSSIVQKSSASMAGANLPRTNKNVFDSIKIPLPPLETQKQIVAKLSAVQDYKKQLLEQKAKIKELFDSSLAKSMKN